MAKLIFLRAATTLSLPIVLLWAFFGTLFREIGSAFYQAWLEVRIETDSYRRLMSLSVEDIERKSAEIRRRRQIIRVIREATDNAKRRRD